MGQHNLKNIYKNYTTYVSTSTSEGFGLTLLEAVGSGLGMIGYDVPYGNQTFIQSEVNGLLVSYSKNETSKNISAIAEAIVKHQKQSQTALEKVREASYHIAQPFLTSHIQKKWAQLEAEVTHA